MSRLSIDVCQPDMSLYSLKSSTQNYLLYVDSTIVLETTDIPSDYAKEVGFLQSLNFILLLRIWSDPNFLFPLA